MSNSVVDLPVTDMTFLNIVSTQNDQGFDIRIFLLSIKFGEAVHKWYMVRFL